MGPAPISAEVVTLLAEIRDELRALREELSRRRDNQVGNTNLISALTDYFGAGSRFTASGVLQAAEDEPALADALAELLDMNAAPRGRAIRLGAILSRMPELEIVAQQRGVAVYRMRGYDAKTECQR